MLVVRTSPRAFALALIPLAGLHAILGIMGVIGHMAGQTPLPSPDRAFGIFVLRLSIDATLLVVGHLILQALRYQSRASYALMGGIAVTLGYVVAYAGEIWIASPTPGAVVTAALLPVVFGMITGFLYGQFAARFEQAETAEPAPPTMTSAYTGALQVRTSVAAVVIAAIVPATLVATIYLMVTYTTLADLQGGDAKFWERQAFAFALPAQVFLVTLMTTAIPAAIFVPCVHALARAIRRTSGLDYTGIGFALALVISGGFLVFTGMLFFAVPVALIGAAMGAVYRRFAGLEPMSLPEPVLARDPRELVDADHPSRRSHAVVWNG